MEADERRRLERVCVFAGSSTGVASVYVTAARDLGTLLGERGVGLVYGGAAVGLMGICAEAAMEAGGEVIGVIPEALLQREIAKPDISELRVVNSMHERKALMADLSDAFIGLPGGAGTLEELFEVWTWGLLGLHDKAFGLLNAGGYYDGLLDFVDHMVDEGFLRGEYRDMLAVEASGDALLEALASWTPPPGRSAPPPGLEV